MRGREDPPSAARAVVETALESARENGHYFAPVWHRLAATAPCGEMLRHPPLRWQMGMLLL